MIGEIISGLVVAAVLAAFNILRRTKLKIERTDQEIVVALSWPR